MLEIFTRPATWTALVSLAAMEVVLGLDNLVFISILTGKLPKAQRRLVTRIGVGAALVLRIGLLFTISWIMHLSYVLFTIGDHGFSLRHLVLFVGGLFLMGKATTEIHEKVEHKDEEEGPKKQATGSAMAIAQIVLIDLVFSIDSVITAVGMVESVPVMVVAMVIAVISMMFFAGSIGVFVEKHPSMKILALSFSVLVELLNLRFRAKAEAAA